MGTIQQQLLGDYVEVTGIEGRVILQNRDCLYGIELIEVEEGGELPTPSSHGYFLSKNDRDYFFDANSGNTLYARALGSTATLTITTNHMVSSSTSGGGGGGSSIDYTSILTNIKTAVQGVNLDTDNLTLINTHVDELESLISTGNITLNSVKTILNNIVSELQKLDVNTDNVENLLNSQLNLISTFVPYIDDLEGKITETNQQINTLTSMMFRDTSSGFKTISNPVNLKLDSIATNMCGYSILILSGNLVITTNSNTETYSQGLELSDSNNFGLVNSDLLLNGTCTLLISWRVFV